MATQNNPPHKYSSTALKAITQTLNSMYFKPYVPIDTTFINNELYFVDTLKDNLTDARLGLCMRPVEPHFRLINVKIHVYNKNPKHFSDIKRTLFYAEFPWSHNPKLQCAYVTRILETIALIVRTFKTEELNCCTDTIKAEHGTKKQL